MHDGGNCLENQSMQCTKVMRAKVGGALGGVIPGILEDMLILLVTILLLKHVHLEPIANLSSHAIRTVERACR